MNMKFLDTAKNLYFKTKFKVVDHSPEILMAIGIIELGVTIYSACKATLKFKDIIEEHNKRIEEIKDLQILAATGQLDEEYTDEDAKNERRAAYIDTGIKSVRCWSPVFFNGLASAGCFTWATGIEKGRFFAAKKTAANLLAENMALKATNRALQQNASGASQYSEGEEQPEESDETFSPGTFDYICDMETCTHWSDTPWENKIFLEQQENWCQHILTTRKFLYLNEALEFFGLDKVESGQIYGWRFYDNTPNPYGENCFSCGLTRPINDKFMEAQSNVAYLTFNVDRLPIVGRCGWKKK